MNKATSNPLAIIVPAYKAKFLRATLASIEQQTDKRFQLYVFDDRSPEPVEQIVQEFSGRLPLKFHRFDENLGGVSLVRHWERCVRLTSEPWIWIFADDDVMEAGCVADFYAEMERTQGAHDLYRFNTVWIGAAGEKISESSLHPPVESGVDFLFSRFAGKRNATLQELIFSRTGWEAAGGIPDFPMAWHSDEAFTAALGVRRPLCAISGARVNWRFSNDNISGIASFAVTNRKIIASTEFFHWVVTFFQAHAAPQTAAAIKASEHWLLNCLRTRWEFIELKTCLAVDRLAREAWQRPRGWGLFKGLMINMNFIVKKLYGGVVKRGKSL